MLECTITNTLNYRTPPQLIYTLWSSIRPTRRPARSRPLTSDIRAIQLRLHITKNTRLRRLYRVSMFTTSTRLASTIQIRICTNFYVLCCVDYIFIVVVGGKYRVKKGVNIILC